jgi:hypothetical protein
MATLQERATAAGGWFKRHKRGEDLIWVTKDGAPEWVRDMCHAAHQDGTRHGMMPDDWRYSFIVEALDLLSECDDPDDVYPEPDVYTSELTAWLASRNDRHGYCDESMHEMGHHSQVSTIDVIMAGQVQEKREVLAAVREYLETSDGWGDDDDE